MKSRKEIIQKIIELTPEFEKAQDSYFSLIKDKQSGKGVCYTDFLKTESEYEILKKEIETLQWIVYGGQKEKKKVKNENSLSHKKGRRPSSIL